MHILFVCILYMTKRYEHQYKFLFNFNKCFIISYILFLGSIWIIHSYDNIVTMGLFGYLFCIFLFICSIFTLSLVINTKEPCIEKVSLLERIKLLWENKNNIKYILCFIIIITMFIRYNCFYITGINISEYTYIPLVSFIVLVTLVPISFSLLVILTIYNGFNLSYGIKYATNQVKESINSSSFLPIIIITITICLVKFLAFPFIFSYFLSMFPKKEDIFHGGYQAESSTKLNKDPYSDPEPNEDIHMGNNEDSDDSDYDYPDIVSIGWPDEYFKGCPLPYYKLDLCGTYIKPHIDQVLLGTSVKDIFAQSKTTIDISQLRTDLKFDDIKKTWKKDKESFVLINLEKRLAMRESEAKRLTYRNLEKDISINKELVSNNLKTYLEKYNKAYFDSEDFWIIADYTRCGDEEDSYYKFINCLLKHYFTSEKGFLV